MSCLLWSRTPARFAAVAHPLTRWAPSGIEELREKREALQVQIQDEELEKSKIQQDLQASAARALCTGCTFASEATACYLFARPISEAGAYSLIQCHSRIFKGCSFASDARAQALQRVACAISCMFLTASTLGCRSSQSACLISTTRFSARCLSWHFLCHVNATQPGSAC